MVPIVFGIFSQTPTITYAFASRAASHSASISGPGISTEFLKSSTENLFAMALVAE
jgi:hypothetical protein